MSHGVALADVVLQTEGLVPELRLYEYAVGVLAVMTAVFLGWTVRLPQGRRRYGLAATAVTAAMCLGYAGMAMELLRVASVDGEPVPASRFVGYVASFTLIVLTIGWIADASRGQLAVLVVVANALLGAIVASWYFADPESLAAAGGAVVFLLVLSGVFLGPIAGSAATVSGERHLLYGKLRNLVLLVWAVQLVNGLVSRQGLGLTDAFVGIFLGTYMDVAIVVGFGLLLLRADTALAHLAGPDPRQQADAGAAGSTGD